MNKWEWHQYSDLPEGYYDWRGSAFWSYTNTHEQIIDHILSSFGLPDYMI